LISLKREKIWGYYLCRCKILITKTNPWSLYLWKTTVYQQIRNYLNFRFPAGSLRHQYYWNQIKTI
jgi:hypothetical protein